MCKGITIIGTPKRIYRKDGKEIITKKMWSNAVVEVKHVFDGASPRAERGHREAGMGELASYVFLLVGL